MRTFGTRGLAVITFAAIIAGAVALAPKEAEAAPPWFTITSDGGVRSTTGLRGPAAGKVQCTDNVRCRCDQLQRDGGPYLADTTSELIVTGDPYKIDLAGSDTACSCWNPDAGGFTCYWYKR